MSQPEQPSHEAWEYRVEYSTDASDSFSWLEQAGKEGWELVGTLSSETIDKLILKRSLGYSVRIFPLERRDANPFGEQIL
jgi:hypothetical protein